MNIFNLKNQKNLRRKLRNQPAVAEKLLWNKLRNRNLLNLKFRRQYGIGKYVVNFYCPELKLVIELDGSTHSSEEDIASDIEREKYIKSFKIIIKRYWNNSIYNDIDLVLEDICVVCLGLQNKEDKNYTPS